MNDTDADSAAPWFETAPDRLAWELRCFEERGLDVQTRIGRRDGTSKDSLVAETELSVHGKLVPIEIVFPFEYPDETPSFFAATGLIGRHQNPSSGNLCWAEDQDRAWSPTYDAAGVVAQTIRELLEDSALGDEAVGRGEADMAEPVSGHVWYTGHFPVIVPDPYFTNHLPAIEGGMTIRQHRGERHTLRHAARLGAADAAALDRVLPDDGEDQDGHWVALDPTPTAEKFEQSHLLPLIDATAPHAVARLKRRLKVKKRDLAAECWLGLTFLEEGPLRGQHRRNWVFARLSLRRDGTKMIDRFTQAQALTRAERQRRIPELTGLDQSRVLIAGAGSVGGTLTLELARAGVDHVDVIDADTIDVNNSVRHVVGPEWAGCPKASLVALSAERLNPFVTIADHAIRIGGGAEAAERLKNLVDMADVVVDTTGSNAVARILQRYCISANTKFVIAGLSSGSFGGEVAIFGTGGACFECFVMHQGDKTIPEPDRAPPQPGVTPVGCSHPAFSGAGFDATQLSAVAARVVIQATGRSRYPDAGFDWAVLNFRDAPRWRSGWLSRHPKCPRCG